MIFAQERMSRVRLEYLWVVFGINILKLTALGSLKTSYWSWLSITSPETDCNPLVAVCNNGFTKGYSRYVSDEKISFRERTYFQGSEYEHYLESIWLSAA